MIPAGLLLIPGLVFLHFAQWYALGWLLFLWWCVAPVTGWALAWAVYTLQKKRRA